MAGYGDDTAFATWAAENGYTVPAGTVATARQRGSVYIDGTYDRRFPGTPTSGLALERSWPRTGAEDHYGNAIGASSVPTRVIEAGYEAALQELTTAGSLSVSTSENERLKRLKAGSVELEYADAGKSETLAGAIPKLTIIEGLLAPLLVADDMPAILIV